MRSHAAPFGLLFAVLLQACAGRPALPGHPASGTLRLRVSEGGVHTVRDVPLEEYVVGVALSELAPAGIEGEKGAAMFEIQTVIARSYAQAHRGRHIREGFDLCSTTHCQVYEPERLALSRWTRTAGAAAARTAGLILWHGNLPADAVYHADCGGHTSAAADVWSGEGRPYLRAQPDDGAAHAAHAAWRYAVTSDRLQRALAADARTRGTGRLKSITVITRDGSGRAQRVSMRGDREVTVLGTALRAVLSAAFGERSIRSTRFDVMRDGHTFVFSGRGFGHGVGLCQAGAQARIAAGESPRAVLRRYYPGTELADVTRSSGPAPD